jgi:hypothetical protein
MKIFLYIAMAAIGAACNNNKEAMAEKEAEAEAQEPDTIVVVKEPAEPQDSLVISFEKTPCFGRCPVYKVKVYDSGFATYEGLNFAEKMGLYSTNFTQKQIEEIYQKALEIGYFSLKAEYNDTRISDLPSTISRVNYKAKDHKVVARTDIPESLKNFHENLAVTLQEKDWESYSNR